MSKKPVPSKAMKTNRHAHLGGQDDFVIAARKLDVTGVATSQATAELAQSLGMRLAELSGGVAIDIVDPPKNAVPAQTQAAVPMAPAPASASASGSGGS